MHVVVDDAGTHLQWALQSPAYSWRWSPYDLHHLMMLGCAGESCQIGFALVDECGSWDRTTALREKRILRTSRCDQCGELKVGNEEGAFCHRGVRIGLRLKLKLLIEAEV